MPSDTPDGGPGDITALLSALEAGDRDAADRLFVLVYDELRRLAGRQLRRGAGETLTPTALVHETYMKLGSRDGWSARDRVHFFALAARAMRQILVDRARERGRVKRGGGAAPATLGALDGMSAAPPLEEMLAVDRALTRLEAEDPELARLVEWRFFAGLSVEEIASALDVSERTVKRQWRSARAILFRELSPGVVNP